MRAGDHYQELRARVSRYVALAPGVTIAVGLLGAVGSWALFLVGRRALESLPAADDASSALLALGAFALYWSGTLQAAVLLYLVPLAVWGRAHAHRPWPRWLGLVQTILTTVAAALMFRGRLEDAALVTGFGAFLAGRGARGGPTAEAVVPLVVPRTMILFGAPFVSVFLLSEPAWLRGPHADHAAVLQPVLVCGLPWLALQLAGPRIFHSARAGRADPVHTWLLPTILIVIAFRAGRGANLLAAGGITLGGVTASWAAGRLLRAPRSSLLLPAASVALSYASLFGAVLLPVLLAKVPPFVAGVLGGVLAAIPIALRGWSHVGGLSEFIEGGGIWREWLAVPSVLTGEAPASGRALRRSEQEIAALLDFRAVHPTLPFRLPDWPYGPGETGPLGEVVAAVRGRRTSWRGLRRVRWLANPDILLDDVADAPLAVRAELGELSERETTARRRLIWLALQVRVDLHAGRIDAAVTTMGRFVATISSGRLGTELGEGGLVDVLEGAGGPLLDHARPRLASSGALVETLGMVAAELEQVYALSLAARDPTALRAVEALRHDVDSWRDVFLPAAPDTVEDAARVAARARGLLVRAHLRRAALDPEPAEDLMDDILAMWWEEGLAPVLARADGEPRAAGVVAESWWAALQRHVAGAPVWSGLEDWEQAFQRRIRGADRLPCGVDARAWRRSFGIVAEVPVEHEVPLGLPFPHLSPPRDLVRGLFDDDLRLAPTALNAAVALVPDDLRALPAPLIRRFAGGVPSLARFMDMYVGRWVPSPWRAAPRALLPLWEAASLVVAELPGGEEEAARLDAQRCWLADRLGTADDRALARRFRRGDGLVARRLRAEAAEHRLRLLEDPGEFVACAERLARRGAETAPDPVLPELASHDAVVIQALLDREILTYRRDSKGASLERAAADTFALLERMDAWRDAMRGGAPATEEADWFGDWFGERLVTPGVLHYVGIGPLARLPVAALRVDGREMGRSQAWIRYECPSRVGPDVPAGPLRGGVALWSRRHADELPDASVECIDLDPLRPTHATLQATRDALRGPFPVHFACHARGGRLDDADAELQCEEGTLSVATLGIERVRAPIVYLSACEAAVGSLVAGEQPLGVTGALLARGAGYVVATQWRICDAVAPDVARRFWKGARARKTPAVALRDALAVDTNPVHRWAVVEVHGGERQSRPTAVTP